jgi:hypothetical protein
MSTTEIRMMEEICVENDILRNFVINNNTVIWVVLLCSPVKLDKRLKGMNLTCVQG